MLVKWNKARRNEFAEIWPCCDVPSTGWADFEDNGDLVGLSPNTQDCESSGGLVEFLADLQKEA